ncbi:MAG: hypothetical protein HY369_00965 [Candidatus Aenigmarchaeota archaeon]|nr:hypothetical protein [Candidatus Aenigmarchaeota archaeon]
MTFPAAAAELGSPDLAGEVGKGDLLIRDGGRIVDDDSRKVQKDILLDEPGQEVALELLL